MEQWTIKGGVLEYIDETHTYIYDGIVLPSITQILKCKFCGKYDRIPPEILQRAAEMGIVVHKAVEDYEQRGVEVDIPELWGWKFLKKVHQFDCIANEVPVVLFRDGVAVAGGRLDLVLAENGHIGLGDIKRTAKLDKKYLAYQLNLYRKAYMDCYGTEISFLRGVHLRNDVRRYVGITINENLVDEVLNEYERENGYV